MLWEQLSNYNLFNLPEYYKFTLVRQTLYFLRDLKFYLISKSFKNVSLSVEYLKKVFDSIISPLSELQCLLDYLDTNPKLNSLYVYGGGESRITSYNVCYTKLLRMVIFSGTFLRSCFLR